MRIHKRTERQRAIPNDVQRYVNRSIEISRQINLILMKQGKKPKDLADLLGKTQSEISKWLSGRHNFTLKSIAKIESVLNENILVCPKDTRKHYVVVMQNSPSLELKGKTNKTWNPKAYKTFSVGSGISVTAKDRLTVIQ